MEIDTLIVNGCSHAYGDGAQVDQAMFDRFFPDVEEAIDILTNDPDHFFVKYTQPYFDDGVDHYKNYADSFESLPRWTNLLEYKNVFNIGQNGSNIEIDYDNALRQAFSLSEQAEGKTVYLLMIGNIHRGGARVYLKTLQRHQQLANKYGWTFYVLPLDFEEFIAWGLLKDSYFSNIIQDHNILSKSEYKDYWQTVADKPNFPPLDFYFNLLQCEMLKDNLIAPCRHANQKGQKIFSQRIQKIINEF